MTNSYPGYYDAFVARYDSIGTLIWTDNFGGIYDDVGNSLSGDNNGNVFVTGYFSGATLTFGADTLHNASSYNLYVIKYDPIGNVLWAEAPAAWSIAQGYCIDTDPMGNAYVSGFSFNDPFNFGSLSFTNDLAMGGDAMIYFKLAPNGTPLCGGSLASGGDDIAPIATDNFNNVFFSGDIVLNFYVGSTFLNNYGQENVFLAKLAPPLGIAEGKPGQQLLFYPDPLTPESTLKMTKNFGVATLEIKNIFGRTQIRKQISGFDTGITAEELKSGVYFISVASDAESFSQKIVILH
jgi:hypothetical protein